jgi:hypothetical protein
MNRLRDGDGDDPIATRGINLLRGTPPAGDAAELRRRVWSSLQHAERHAPVAYGARRIKMLAVVVTIVCVAGSASALIARRWIVPHSDRAAQTGTPMQRPDVKTTTKRKLSAHNVAGQEIVAPGLTGRVAPTLAPAEVTPANAAVTSSSVRSPSARIVDAKGSRVRRTLVSSSAPGSASPTISASPSQAVAVASPMPSLSMTARSLVLDAMIALRTDGDPARAAVLLNRYLATHPSGNQGTLREEALVLSIEAADARADRAAARDFARVYQSEYPGGRFGAFARTHAE